MITEFHRTIMTHHLTYLRAPDHAPATITWVSPTGWSDETIRENFQQQFPGAVVIKMDPMP